ncbi:uncharacterized protein METZ01_LOCUS139336, partial [marine metagenome]
VRLERVYRSHIGGIHAVHQSERYGHP